MIAVGLTARCRRSHAAVRVWWVVLALLVASSLGADVRARVMPQSAPPAQLLERVREYSQEVPGGYGTLLKLTTGPQGSVRLSSWRRQAIRIQAHIVTRAPSEADLDVLGSVVGVVIEPSLTSVEVLTSGPHESKWLKGVKKFPKALKQMPWHIDYDITVPEYTALDVAVYAGELQVDGISGIVSLISASGNIHISNSSGSLVANAVTGSVEVATREKSWHGGSLRVTAGRDVLLTLPHDFSGYFDAAAPGGIVIAGEQHRDLGPSYRGDVGHGGGGVSLTAGGKVVIVVGSGPPPETTAEPAIPADKP